MFGKTGFFEGLAGWANVLAAPNGRYFDEDKIENDSFPKRLITGAVAEGSFEASFPNLTVFMAHSLTHVTRYRCGFDFRVVPPAPAYPFLAVKVMGIGLVRRERLLSPVSWHGRVSA